MIDYGFGMVNASNTGTATGTGDRSGARLKRLFTGVVGKMLGLVVGLIVFATGFSLVTPDTAMMGVIVGMAYSLAGVIILVGIIVTIAWAIR